MSTRAIVVMFVISAVAGVAGAAAVLFFYEGVGGWGTFWPLHAIASGITWGLLTPFVVNRSVARAILVGLLSPVVACIVFLPLWFLGLYWAVALIRYWWLTVPIGIGTSLSIQLFASDYSGGYRLRPRIAALLMLFFTMGVAAAPPIVRSLNGPLRADTTSIRSRLIIKAPVGSSPEDVLRALGTTIDYERETTRSYYGAAKYESQRQAHDRVGYPVGQGSIEATLGSYRTRRGTVRVHATWAFDADGRLLDVFVIKRWLYGKYGVPDPE